MLLWKKYFNIKGNIGIPSDQFLKQHTISAFRDNKYFPSLMLKMSDDKEKSCPFLSGTAYPKGFMKNVLRFDSPSY
jgi:hypothetical protein